MNLVQLFGAHWKKNFSILFNEETKLVVALSGGIDSVVLCHLLRANDIPFSIAHANFQLRAEESDRDELFVRELAKQLNAEFAIKTFDTIDYATEHKLSIQEAARKLRYDWFSTFEQTFVATGHHANDSVETLLMQFFRGTGIEGLKGIPERAMGGQVIRPLLSFTRAQIEAYRQENRLVYVEDSSNKKADYTRNFFRNDLLPRIAEVFPKAEENLLGNIRRFCEANELYKEAVVMRLGRLMERRGEEWYMGIENWKGQAQLETITWELIKKFNYSSGQVGEVIKLLDGVNGASIESTTHKLFKNRRWMVIAPLRSSGAITQLPINHIGSYNVGHFTLELSLENKPANLQKDSNTEYVDASNIQFPLLLRKWKQGDYFYPLGMPKKKKIARFLIDKKLSLTEKENVWVLECNQKIICVLGQRIDDRFKVTEETKRVMVIKTIDNGQ